MRQAAEEMGQWVERHEERHNGINPFETAFASLKPLPAAATQRWPRAFTVLLPRPKLRASVQSAQPAPLSCVWLLRQCCQGVHCRKEGHTCPSRYRSEE